VDHSNQIKLYSLFLMIFVSAFSLYVFMNYPISLYGALLFATISFFTSFFNRTLVKTNSGKIQRDIHFSLSFLCLFFFGIATALGYALIYAILLAFARWKAHPKERRLYITLLNTFMSVLTQTVIFAAFFSEMDRIGLVGGHHTFVFYLKILVSGIVAENLHIIFADRFISKLLNQPSTRLTTWVRGFNENYINHIHHSLIESILLVMGLLAIEKFIFEPSELGIALVLFMTYILARFMKESFDNAYNLKRQSKNLIESNELLRESNKKMYKLNRQVLKSLTATLEMKDMYTAGHSKRVAYYAFLVGQEMGLSKKQLRTLYYGGLVHDIGKIAIQEAILTKPSRITIEEFEEIKRHPVIGSEWIQRYLMPMGDYEEYEQIYQMVRHHHERFDGKGYPDRMGGDDIPLLASLLSVVDAFDAMTSQRSYRSAFTFEQAYDEIVQNAGTQFCPQVVSWFCLAFRKKRWQSIESYTLVSNLEDTEETG
jgi:HD-GYP domain-containing protein (c-di-GMP phosphodiesterase class II)